MYFVWFYVSNAFYSYDLVEAGSIPTNQIVQFLTLDCACKSSMKIQNFFANVKRFFLKKCFNQIFEEIFRKNSKSDAWCISIKMKSREFCDDKVQPKSACFLSILFRLSTKELSIWRYPWGCHIGSNFWGLSAHDDLFVDTLVFQ